MRSMVVVKARGALKSLRAQSCVGSGIYWCYESYGGCEVCDSCRCTEGFVAYECFGSLRSMGGGKAIGAWRSVRVMGCVRGICGVCGD